MFCEVHDNFKALLSFASNYREKTINYNLFKLKKMLTAVFKANLSSIKSESIDY